MWEFPAWDPVLVPLPGPLDLRWYGLMYVVAFACAQFIMTRLQAHSFFAVQRERVADLVFYTVIGTILGGRFGYALFYTPELLNPLEFIKVWQGGLSFHGGLIGVSVGFWLFARRNGLPILRVGDVCALAVTPGILAVRMANFINGELYGRICDAGTFGAMRFPTDPIAMRRLGLLDDRFSKREIEIGTQYAVGHLDKAEAAETLGDRVENIRLWSEVKDQVPWRHPSQLYEGFGEGLLLGLVLLAVYLSTRKRPWAPGKYGGVFLIGYGVVRFLIEYLRQPDRQFRDSDDQVGYVFLSFTMGQVLCFSMIVIGATLLLWPRKMPAGGGAAQGGGGPESTSSAEG